MGTTATKVRSWERGDAVPDDATLEQLAEELNMSPGVLRATLPETEPQLDEADDATSVVAAPAFSSEVDTAGAELETADDVEAVDAAESDEAGDAEADGRDDAEGKAGDAAGGESAEDEQPVDGGQEPTALIAAAAAAGDHPGTEGPTEDREDEALMAPAGAAATSEGEGAGTADDDDVDADEQQSLLDAPTEAVAVVPTIPPREPATGGMVPAAPAVAVATAPVRVDLNDVGVPEPSGFFAPIEQAMAVIFDPDKSYLMWIRLILTVVVFFIMLRVLAWAVPEFFDALKDILDTIESTPSEPDPASGFIEGLGRIAGA